LSTPDYIEPLVGWRSWLVVSVEGELVLCSPMYLMLWPPGEAVVASCQTRSRPAGVVAWPPHPVPWELCHCGIHASQSAQSAVSYASAPNLARHIHEVEQPVFGRVSLWGLVVECEHGWRAEHAYPAALHVPALTVRRGRDREQEHPSLPAEAIADALTRYGVPVELIASETLRDAAQQLEQQS
jgi:hypothetical protein